jgi:hypothetical protein
MEDAIKTTMSFCQANAGSLGFTEEEQASKDAMIARCITPILDAARVVTTLGSEDLNSSVEAITNNEETGPSEAVETTSQVPPSGSMVR